MFDTLVSIALVLIAFLAGMWASGRNWFGLAPAAKPVVQERSTLLLERIRNVCKLVTVEGYISEIYDYKHYKWYNNPLFSKKALIRVRAKVLVGYDLSKMNIRMEPETKTVLITHFPQPHIISIEDEMDYYDVNNGVFNVFMPEDYNDLNQRAKEFIRAHAENSGLLESAAVQGNKMLELVHALAENADWKVRYIGTPEAPPPRLLNEKNS